MYNTQYSFVIEPTQQGWRTSRLNARAYSKLQATVTNIAHLNFTKPALCSMTSLVSIRCQQWELSSLKPAACWHVFLRPRWTDSRGSVTWERRTEILKYTISWKIFCLTLLNMSIGKRKRHSQCNCLLCRDMTNSCNWLCPKAVSVYLWVHVTSKYLRWSKTGFLPISNFVARIGLSKNRFPSG